MSIRLPPRLLPNVFRGIGRLHPRRVVPSTVQASLVSCLPLGVVFGIQPVDGTGTLDWVAAAAPLFPPRLATPRSLPFPQGTP